jgi:hypothetical protein
MARRAVGRRAFVMIVSDRLDKAPDETATRADIAFVHTPTLNDNGSMSLELAHPHALRDVLPWQMKLGSSAYEDYRRALAGRSPVTGDPLPEWHHLHPEIMRAYIVMACSIRSRFNSYDEY